ncbi:MAG: hypothetical protein E3J64_03475 [Anaerolineales bacterium]|nr:MAG: hypothetical protein E3J64_03475 [Anaerolineales bacterium]
MQRRLRSDKRDQDLTGRLMEDMDPELLDFLRRKVNTFVKWDLVRFFHDNPHTTDTANNVARYAGRNVETIRDELAQLAEAGVLEQNRLGEMVIYSLSSSTEIRELLDLFVEALSDREFRVKAIYHVVREAR